MKDVHMYRTCSHHRMLFTVTLHACLELWQDHHLQILSASRSIELNVCVENQKLGRTHHMHAPKLQLLRHNILFTRQLQLHCRCNPTLVLWHPLTPLQLQPDAAQPTPSPSSYKLRLLLHQTRPSQPLTHCCRNPAVALWHNCFHSGCCTPERLLSILPCH